jgi:hypothetical protein
MTTTQPKMAMTKLKEKTILTKRRMMKAGRPRQ